MDAAIASAVTIAGADMLLMNSSMREAGMDGLTLAASNYVSNQFLGGYIDDNAGKYSGIVKAVASGTIYLVANNFTDACPFVSPFAQVVYSAGLSTLAGSQVSSFLQPYLD